MSRKASSSNYTFKPVLLEATYDIKYNPNGSYFAVEGITSPDGRIFGKMAHSERFNADIFKNIHGDMDQKIFEAGVNYFK